MAHVSFTDLRKKLATHLDEIERDRTTLVVTRQNHPDMVIMPLSELESIHETMHLLGTPANARRLREAIDQLDAGRGAERELHEPAER